MDGRGRVRKEDPWGWEATTWQAWSFFLLAALLLSNAAWFYRLRVAAAESPPVQRSSQQPIAKDHNSPYDWQAVEAAARRDLARPMPLKPGERCIRGQRFATVDGALQNIGSC